MTGPGLLRFLGEEGMGGLLVPWGHWQMSFQDGLQSPTMGMLRRPFGTADVSNRAWDPT